jgi:hypothetical protein|tara:strand:- start:28 stop:468 length:441 start_codon:yes stop_codon:yes gene_type:complete
MRRFRDTEYMISEDGGIYRNGKKRKPYLDIYQRLNLSINGVTTTFYVHRIVAEAYLGASDLCVDHIDNDKTNNHVSNLQYLTRAENINKERQHKDLPMHVSKSMKRGKWAYQYRRSVGGKQVMFINSISLSKVLRFKLNYERLWNV